MNKKGYYVIFLLCFTILILVSGCSSGRIKSISKDVSSDKPKNKLTLTQIKENYNKTDEKILNIQEYKNYVLVESQAPTIANHFTLYDLKTGVKNVLPNGAKFIESARIIDENHIILYGKGTDSESALQAFPFQIDCIRGAENNDSDTDFIPIYSELKIPIYKQISLMGKENEVLNDIRVTVNGLQVCFGSQSSNNPNFYADYLDSPTVDISYDKIKNELYLKFQNTIIARSLYQAISSLQYNSYINSLNLHESDNAAIITIKLSNMANFYIGKKASIIDFNKPGDTGIPYIDIQFFNSNL